MMIWNATHIGSARRPAGADCFCELTVADDDGHAVALLMPRRQFRQFLVACLNAVPIAGHARMSTAVECNSIDERSPPDGGFLVEPGDGGGIAVTVASSAFSYAMRIELSIKQLERFFEQACAIYGAESSDIFRTPWEPA